MLHPAKSKLPVAVRRALESPTFASKAQSFGRAYALYFAVKWGVLTVVVGIMSQVEGFQLAWLLWWPVIGIPGALGWRAHRKHAQS
ncbi:hypothetical protein [Reinekea sp. G2M2-21]|uniref:hypothetical protein n=1 Tax=Reinekea sp. G2M2-21 TaxID=2788942 RepID=UPI0018AAB590|nr:hypothetical protein [Reinekea sp. G2M2-21]